MCNIFPFRACAYGVVCDVWCARVVYGVYHSMYDSFELSVAQLLQCISNKDNHVFIR